MTDTVADQIDHTYDSRTKLLTLRAGGHSMTVKGISLDRANRFVEEMRREFERRASTTDDRKRALAGLFTFGRSLEP